MKHYFITASTSLLLCVSSLSLHAATAHQGKSTAHHPTQTQRQSSAGATDNAAPVLLNTANIEQLASIKGIGSKRAATIVNYRDTHGQFTSLDQLTNIRGISANSLQRIMEHNPGKLRLG